MSMSIARRLVAAASLVALLLAYPGVAGATITGGCTGEGHSSSSSANLTTDTEWHLQKDDVAGGSGTAPAPMTSASVAAYGLGIGLPIAGGTDKDGKTSGSVDGVSVSTYAILGHRFVVAGSASGGGSCSGEITIILDDVDPLFTVLGGGGILLALIGILAVVYFMRSGGGCFSRVLSGAAGGLGGAGGALAAEQFDLLDPTEPFGLFVAIGAAIVGFVTAGMFGGDKSPTGTGGTNPPPSRPAPPTDDTQSFIDGVAAPAVDAPISDPNRPSVGGSASGPSDGRMGGRGDDPIPPGGVGGGGPM